MWRRAQANHLICEQEFVKITATLCWVFVGQLKSPNLASHAWIDFCIDINEGKWISVDITHACLIDSRHIRLAVGRDYYSAAPVKGVRSGGGFEALSASISIHQLS